MRLTILSRFYRKTVTRRAMNEICIAYSRHLCTGSNQNTGPVSSRGVKTDHLSVSRHVRGHDTCHVSSL